MWRHKYMVVHIQNSNYDDFTKVVCVFINCCSVLLFIFVDTRCTCKHSMEISNEWIQTLHNDVVLVSTIPLSSMELLSMRERCVHLEWCIHLDWAKNKLLPDCWKYQNEKFLTYIHAKYMEEQWDNLVSWANRICQAHLSVKHVTAGTYWGLIALTLIIMIS